GADLDGVVVPEGGLAVVAGRAAAALVLDGIDGAVLFLDDIELAGETEARRAELDAARVQDVALLAGALLQGRIVDAPVLEEAVLDVLIDGKHRLDVFEIVEALAVGDLIEGPD